MRLASGGQTIDVTVGHAAPFLFDFDRDGVRDLLVGEFGDVDFPNARLPQEHRNKPPSSYKPGEAPPSP